MIAALEDYLPDQHFLRLEGGFFVGLTLNRPVDAALLTAQARLTGVDLADGSRFFVGPPRRPFLRLPFCSMDEDTARRGIGTIAEILAQLS